MTEDDKPALMIDLHIKATSIQEAETLAASIEGFERSADPPGVGIETDSIRIRGSIKLSQAVDPGHIAAIFIADSYADTQNSFLDGGWKANNFSRHSMGFSRAMPQRPVAPKPASPPSQSWLAVLGRWLKRLLNAKH